MMALGEGEMQRKIECSLPCVMSAIGGSLLISSFISTSVSFFTGLECGLEQCNGMVGYGNGKSISGM